MLHGEGVSRGDLPGLVPPDLPGEGKVGPSGQCGSGDTPRPEGPRSSGAPRVAPEENLSRGSPRWDGSGPGSGVRQQGVGDVGPRRRQRGTGRSGVESAAKEVLQGVSYRPGSGEDLPHDPGTEGP